MKFRSKGRIVFCEECRKEAAGQEKSIAQTLLLRPERKPMQNHISRSCHWLAS